GNVPAGSHETGDKAIVDRVIIKRHDNRNRRSCSFSGTGWRWATGNNDVYLETYWFGGKAGRRSGFPSAYRHSMTMFFPSTYPRSLKSCLNASVRYARSEEHTSELQSRSD